MKAPLAIPEGYQAFGEIIQRKCCNKKRHYFNVKDDLYKSWTEILMIIITILYIIVMGNNKQL
jgi:hypothetical protein